MRLLLSFNALGDYPKTKCVGEKDDRTNDFAARCFFVKWRP